MGAKTKCNSHDSLNDDQSPGLALLMQREDATALLYVDPHNPMRHLRRGIIHSKLGYPDLAAADAYRALTLFEAVIDPDSSEYRARKKVALDAVELTGSSSELVDGVAAISVQNGGAGSDLEESENYDDDADEDGHMEEDEGEDEDEDEEEGFESVSQEEYRENIRDVYILLVKSLVQCGCMRDAYNFCIQAMDLPDSELKSSLSVFEEQLSIIKRSFVDRQRSRQQKEGRGGSADNQDQGTDEELLARFQPAALNAQGHARRVLYPWNTHEPDRNAPETLQFLNERLKKIAPKCEVRAVALPALYHNTVDGNPSSKQKEQEEASIQLGLVATENIAPGETFLHESSLLTATNRLHDNLCDACNGPIPELSAANSSVACGDCEDTIFCSQECHDLAQEVYHAAECGQEGLESIGKDIQDPKDKADYLYLLLLGRAIAMAATQGIHPLDLPEVKYIWGDFHPLDDGVLAPTPVSSSSNNNNTALQTPSATLPFSFHLSILQPTRILEEMGLDPFATLPTYDTWVLNTLYAKFRGTASGRLSTWDGGPEVSAVHPLWCLANHSCDPNVRWEWGGEITFTVRREDERIKWGWRKGEDAGDEKWAGIKRGEEILNHYCDVGLGVKERREWAMGALGGACRCERCLWEEKQIDLDER